jgi:hypothetical protein
MLDAASTSHPCCNATAQGTAVESGTTQQLAAACVWSPAGARQCGRLRTAARSNCGGIHAEQTSGRCGWWVVPHAANRAARDSSTALAPSVAGEAECCTTPVHVVPRSAPNTTRYTLRCLIGSRSSGITRGRVAHLRCSSAARAPVPGEGVRLVAACSATPRSDAALLGCMHT